MARKYFMKFRVSGVIPTFNSCRSKDPSTLPSNHVPSFLRRHSTTHQHKPHRSSLKRHFFSARHGCLRSHSHSSPEPSFTGSSKPPNFKWGRDSHWHVIAKIPEYHHNYDSTPPRRKIYNSTASDTEQENDVVLPPPPLKMKFRRRRTLQKVRVSTSSDSCLSSEDNGDDDQERETLVSTNSPIPRFHLHIGKSKEREKKKNKRRSFDSPAVRNSSKAPARLSEFMRKMTPCRAVSDGKVRESYAVEKRSVDPYDDFKRSMVDMVVEKKMFEERELEELLRCFLSLNSERHHEAIVRAFTDIWMGLFCQPPSPELWGDDDDA